MIEFFTVETDTVTRSTAFNCPCCEATYIIKYRPLNIVSRKRIYFEAIVHLRMADGRYTPYKQLSKHTCAFDYVFSTNYIQGKINADNLEEYKNKIVEFYNNPECQSWIKRKLLWDL